MFWYLFSFVLAIVIWYMIKWIMNVRVHQNIVKTIPLHEEMNSMFKPGVLSRVNNSNEFFEAITGWIFRSRVGIFAQWTIGMSSPTYFVVKPDIYKELLDLPVSVQKGFAMKSLKAWLGDGLLMSHGEKWKRNRRLLTPAFHFDILKSYVVIFNRTIDICMENISKLSEERTSIDVEPLVHSATLDTLLRCALSYEDGGQVQKIGEPHPYLHAVDRLNKLFGKRVLNPLLRKDWVFFLTADGKEFLKHCDYVHDFAIRIIASRKKEMESWTESTEAKKRRPDFLDILLQARDPDGKGLTDEEIRCEVDTFMFAGNDTTGSALAWSLNQMAKYPTEQAKVFDEVDTVLGDRTDIEWNDLSELNYLSCFIKEVMRIYPPATALTRTLTDTRTIHGVDFPANTTIGGVVYMLHRHPDIWDQPEEFRPSRFLPENIRGADPYAYLPFSAGSRNCIGQNFAMHEMRTFLAKIVRRFKISTDPQRLASPFIQITISSKDGIYLYFEERTRNDQPKD